MKMYLIRIELHKPFEEDMFKKLHAAMEEVGFSRDIERIKEWFEFELPTAEYMMEKEDREEAVLQLAIETAKSVHEKCSVTVADYGALPWDNFPKTDDL
jgi:hypothetical protein